MPWVRPTQLTANAGSWTHGARTGIEQASSWILVGFIHSWAMMGTPSFPLLKSTFLWPGFLHKLPSDLFAFLKKWKREKERERERERERNCMLQIIVCYDKDNAGEPNSHDFCPQLVLVYRTLGFWAMEIKCMVSSTFFLFEIVLLIGYVNQDLQVSEF